MQLLLFLEILACENDSFSTKEPNKKYSNNKTLIFMHEKIFEPLSESFYRAINFPFYVDIFSSSATFLIVLCINW